jgi:hypothetical protein
MEEDGALEHSLAFAGMAKNSAGSIYKNGTTKPYKEKARVAQMWIDMTGADPHNNQPSIRTLANAAKVSRKFAGKVMAELRGGLLVNTKTLVKSMFPEVKGRYLYQMRMALFYYVCNRRIISVTFMTTGKVCIKQRASWSHGQPSASGSSKQIGSKGMSKS